MKYPVHRMFRRWGVGLLLGVVGLGTALRAQGEELEITAVASTNPVSLVLRIQGYNNTLPLILYRRAATGSYSSWTEVLSTNVPAPAGVATYTDATVVAGTVYEYRADRTDYTGSGYGVGAVEAPAADARGRILLAIEDTLLAPLSNELNRLELDLIGDGWRVLRASVPRYNPALTNAARLAQLATVRDAISNAFTAAGGLEAVYLVGHVPVPYTHVVQNSYWVGNNPPYPPDGHDTHAGCWPGDVYFADITGGPWTDSTVAWTNTTMPRCSTVPGDGKFDNWRIPSAVELQVGRADLSDLTTFPWSETELTRHYLDKVHAYRKAKMPMRRLGAVSDDYTAVRRSLPAWFGPAAYMVTNFATAMQDTNGYLAAAAGGAGSFTSVGAHYTTGDVLTRDPRFFLQMSGGSYFGDWDSNNNVLRATLAGASGGLASLWMLDFGSGYDLVNINWSLNHMALGETLGFGVRYTQNRVFEGITKPSTAYALMGDPTLRLFPVDPPADVTARNQGSDVQLSWRASAEPTLLGYHVYQSTNGLTGVFNRITATPVADTNYLHASALPGTAVYQVRAVKRETSGAGTYHNTSQGIFAQASSDARPAVTITLDPEQVNEEGGPVVFAFARTGETTGSLAVTYSISGTADPQDVTGTLSGVLLLPVGEVRAELVLSLVDDQRLEGTEQLVLTLQTNADFQAGLFAQQTLTILDNEVMPATPTGVVAEAEGNALRINWVDTSSNETAFVLERRDLSAGGTILMDNENTNFVRLAPTNAPWLIQTFTNAWGGNCRTMKQANTTTNYVDYRPGLTAAGTYDLDLWYPSGSVGGSFVVAQTALVVQAGSTNVVVFTPRTNGASWQSLGRFSVATGTTIRLQSASSGSEYSVADAVRLSAPFVAWTQLAANVTTWLDEAVSNPGAYEYRVRAALANTSSVASARATASLGAGVVNRAPFVEAGTNQVGYFPLTNQLNASASDPDDAPQSLVANWRLISGPAGVLIGNTNAYNTTVSFVTNGTYVFGWEAADGETSTLDTVTHIVAPQLWPTNSVNGSEFVVDADTIALWRFNGDGQDATTNGYHLTLSNGCSMVTGGTATAWMAVPGGSALRILNYPHSAGCLIPDAALLNRTNNSPFTLEARFYFEAWGSNSASYQMMGVAQNSDTQMTFDQANAGSPFGKIMGNRGVQIASEVEVGALMNTGTWHHLMLIFDGSNTYRSVLDGVPLGVVVTNLPNWGRTNDHQITMGNFKGYLDEARLSRVARYVPPVANTNPPVASDLGPGSLPPPAQGGFNVGFATVTGQVYQIEFVTSLITNDWQVLSNGIPGTGGSLVVADPSLDSNRYYRIRAWRP